MTSLESIRRWPGLKSKPWVENFLASAAKEKPIVAIIAIGSAIRPRGHRRSDLDLLVVYREEKPRLRAPIEVDIRYFSIDSVDKQIAEGNEIAGWAIRFGLALYDPDGFWEALRAKWLDALPLPSAEEAMQRVSRSLKVARDIVRAGDESAASDLVLAAITQVARARLIRHGIYPASRPELPSQLRDIAEISLAELLDDALDKEISAVELIKRLGVIEKAAKMGRRSPKLRP
jgi:predicted nucleotidyltransferase